MIRLLGKVSIDLSLIASNHIHGVAPWMQKTPYVSFEILEQKKNVSDNPALLKSVFNSIIGNSSSARFIYTDGSKTDEGVSAAVAAGEVEIAVRLPNHSTIFTAEAFAILTALKFIESNNIKHCVICSDSLSCLLAINNYNTKNPIVAEILTHLNKLNERKQIEFVWVPSHIGILGNEKADAIARGAILNRIDPDIKIPYTDLKFVVNQYVKSEMQSHWDLLTLNKLKLIKPRIGQTTFPNIVKRNDETRLHRLRLGHTYLTHRYLLCGEDRPLCVDCQIPLTVEHILINCPSYSVTRQTYFTHSSLHEVFDKVSPTIILKFISDIGLYSEI